MPLKMSLTLECFQKENFKSRKMEIGQTEVFMYRDSKILYVKNSKITYFQISELTVFCKLVA